MCRCSPKSPGKFFHEHEMHEGTEDLFWKRFFGREIWRVFCPGGKLKGEEIYLYTTIKLSFSTIPGGCNGFGPIRISTKKPKHLPRLFASNGGLWGGRSKIFSNYPGGHEIWHQPKLYALLCIGVSKNRGTPKSSILIGFSINHPFWGTIFFWKHPYKYIL